MLFETPDALAQNVTCLNKNRFITFTRTPTTIRLTVRKNGEVEKLTAGGIMSKFPYQEGKSHLDPGDTLVLFTDGVTKAAPVNIDEEFGEGRLAEVVTASKAATSADVVQEILKAVLTFTAGAHPPTTSRWSWPAASSQAWGRFAVTVWPRATIRSRDMIEPE